MKSARLTDWEFTVRRSDGSVRVVTFYSGSRPEALKLARGWVTRMGFALVEDAEKSA